jgi:hypothetical protein
MSGRRSDMSGLGRICPVNKNFVQQKSKSRAKTMRLRPDELTISKLDNIELREITGTTRGNLNMSGSGAEHVRLTSLEPGLGIGYVQSGT